MTDEPPESQRPWPDDRRQPYQRRQDRDLEGLDAPRQPQSQPGNSQQPHDFYPPTQPGYAQPPYQAMAPLFGFDSETTPHWRPPTPRKRKILLAAAYAVAAVAVGIVAGVLVSSSAKPAASKSSAAAAVPPVAVPSAAVPSAAAPSAAPASSPASSDVNAVQSWWASYGTSASQQIGQTMAQLSADATNAETTDDFSAVESDLTTAQGEIQAAQDDPPIPDAALEQLWNTALADYASGVSDMLNGVQNLDPSEIAQGASELVDGNTAVNTLVRDFIDSLGS